MSIILEQIIKDVLKEYVDTNLESEHARETIAEEIASIYYAHSSDWTCSAMNESIGEENVKPD